VIHAQDLPIDIAVALQMEALRYAIVALALLIPIAFWSRAHWQGLQALSTVADEIGSGKLSARTKVKPGASIFPLAQRIDHMAGRIEGLVESQASLLHSVSHELRTPIARLEFALELLRPALPETVLAPRIDAMQADLAELEALVGELLGMARIGSERTVQCAPFALAPALAECVALLDSAGGRRVEVEVAVDPRARQRQRRAAPADAGDRQRAAQCPEICPLSHHLVGAQGRWGDRNRRGGRWSRHSAGRTGTHFRTVLPARPQPRPRNRRLRPGAVDCAQGARAAWGIDPGRGGNLGRSTVRDALADLKKKKNSAARSSFLTWCFAFYFAGADGRTWVSA
jgi:hypothetical protein